MNTAAPKKKCIVLDLDNTLWGGIVGEDGMDNLALSLTPPGSAYIAFQQALLDHWNRGIILAINSRNNPEDAWQVIRTHPNMILKENHFAAHRINWGDKAENIRELAEELNISLDSMVFLDDDPANRELVRAMVPDVETPELPADPSEYARFLNSLGHFDAAVITDEDKMRGNLYVTERLRTEAEKTYATKQEFLRDLGLQLFVHEDDPSCVPRLAQLTEKTNQFNIDKEPLSEDQIEGFIKSPDHLVFHARLQDKFGDHGVIAFALIEKHPDRWHIRQMLMSCRVFGREVEEAFFGAILEQAREENVGRMTIAVRETEKNAPARTFAARHFEDGQCAVPAEPYVPSWIQVIYEEAT